MKKFKSIAASLAATTVLATPLMAGDLVEAPVEPVPVAPVATPPVDYGSDWGGFYGGVQLGYGDVSGDGGLDGIDGDDTFYGVHVGYNHDFGNWVAGAELDYDKMDIDIGDGAATVDDVTRLKLKGGYDLGNTLVYATAGSAMASTSVGDDTGPFYGLGVSYKVTDNWLVGGEVLRHEFDGLGADGNDASANTVSLRASYKF
ncbi:outer membrane beta-barrel protein [Sulfitobacter sp. D35]|uniref:outer membrane protein n=1 Tax=Sulfitobacter sp. D35 TaxID=3083252 RepID=UPI00296F2A0E|nr:outer membrane beta-barrel protein [Sulfitobacter sp. D35]MDW4497559.1 outer membrane beta-barrel protein [Sulfitobacter sp. D35]